MAPHGRIDCCHAQKSAEPQTFAGRWSDIAVQGIPTSEKAARIRGLIELVETAATRVRERQFKETSEWSYSMADDVFRCDYPVRHWIQKTREAEHRAQIAETELERILSEKPSCNAETS